MILRYHEGKENGIGYTKEIANEIHTTYQLRKKELAMEESKEASLTPIKRMT